MSAAKEKTASEVSEFVRITHPVKLFANSRHASRMRTCLYDFCRRTRNTTYQHDNDAGSDLDYAMARYYASRSGRFMTPDPGHVGADPTDPQSWNAYVYGLNDPIGNTDPNGLFAVALPQDPIDIPPCTDVYIDGFYAGKTPGCSGGGPSGPSIVDTVVDTFTKVTEIITQPRDPACMARMTTMYAAAGGVAGGVLGAVGGGAGGAVGGTFVAPGVGTVGGGFGGGAGGFVAGAGYGTMGGAAVGGALGWISCMSSTPGGGSGGGGHKYAGKTVREILKDKKASIKNAPLPPGSPTWESILNKTWEQIDSAAKRGDLGYDTIRKLLTDSRFNK
jgi:RHS repeat-associated protein